MHHQSAKSAAREAARLKRNGRVQELGTVLGAAVVPAVPEGSPSFSIYSVEGAGCGRDCNRRPLVAVWLAVMALGVAVALLVRDVRIDTKEGIGQLDPFNSFLVTL